MWRSGKNKVPFGERTEPSVLDTVAKALVCRQSGLAVLDLSATDEQTLFARVYLLPWLVGADTINRSPSQLALLSGGLESFYNLTIKEKKGNI